VRFWDSSAVVPLIVRQPRSVQADHWLADDPDVVTWTLTLVEIVSALRRLVRERKLTEVTARQAEAVASDLSGHFHMISDIDRVKALACRALRLYPLRANDALQLAAALAWADGHPEGLMFHTLDERLAHAAALEGFAIQDTRRK